MRRTRMVRARTGEVLALSIVAVILSAAPLAAASAQWEVQGELQLTEILDNLESVVQEHASSQEEFLQDVQELDEGLRQAMDEMTRSDAGSPRFRLAKADWAELMSRKIAHKVEWAEGNVHRSSEIVFMIERAIGLITQRLQEMAPEPGQREAFDEMRREMVRLGAQIGLVLHEAATEMDFRTQQALRSVMTGLSEVDEDRFARGQDATFGVYVRLKDELQGLLEATGDLLARNRLQVRRNRIDAEHLEAIIVRDLASMNVSRLEEYTRVLTSPAFLSAHGSSLDSNAGDFAAIETMEARERSSGRRPSNADDTREGLSRLIRRGAAP